MLNKFYKYILGNNYWFISYLDKITPLLLTDVTILNCVEHYLYFDDIILAFYVWKMGRCSA